MNMKVTPTTSWTSVDAASEKQMGSRRSSLEIQAEHLVGENELTMRYADPTSELFVAALARIVVALVTGNTVTRDAAVNKSVDHMDPSSMTVEDLLAFREKKV